MTRAEIVEALAKGHVVEDMCKTIAHASELTADLKDLAQAIYLILLEYPEDKVVDLAKDESLRFFIARVIINQYRSGNSAYHKLFRRFRSLCEELNPYEE